MENENQHNELEELQNIQRSRMIESGKSTEELLEHYKDIATKYDQFINLDGWMDGRKEIAAVLHQTMTDTNVRVLDCGCGTGHTALEIKKLGFEHIDGIDMSPHMLEEAQSKGVFENVILGKIDSGVRSEIENGTYDAVMCNGVFVPGQMDQRSFPELTRITKPGGYIIFSVSDKYLEECDMFANGRLDEAIDQCIKRGEWNNVTKERRSYWRNEKAVIHVVNVA